MIGLLLNKLFFLIFFMSIFYLSRHLVMIIRKLKGDNWREGYQVGTTDLIFMLLSLSYLCSTIFVGIKI